MKRFLSLVLAIILPVSLYACGDEHDEPIDKDVEHTFCEGMEAAETDAERDYDLFKSVLSIAYEHGYLSAGGHDWLMDTYGENIYCSKVESPLDIDFYLDKNDTVFLSLNRDKENGREPPISSDSLLLNILDLAYYEGVISNSGYDWMRDVFYKNKGCSSVKYSLEFYGDETDLVSYYIDQKNKTISSEIHWVDTPRSSCFSKIGYDAGQEVLGVTFRDSGITYFYYDIDPDIWASFSAADSLGTYFNKEIKGFYDYKRID